MQPRHQNRFGLIGTDLSEQLCVFLPPSHAPISSSSPATSGIRSTGQIAKSGLSPVLARSSVVLSRTSLLCVRSLGRMTDFIPAFAVCPCRVTQSVKEALFGSYTRLRSLRCLGLPRSPVSKVPRRARSPSLTLPGPSYLWSEAFRRACMTKCY